jgi:UDP-N-acetylglucosamine--N-acetylmuramyl-(pentapeptide) pyrophosphoryl-undecaprenol N-acetylglucosamine transferase
VPLAGYDIIGLPIVGIQRRLTLKNILVPFKLLLSLAKAKRIIKDFCPQVAIGVGGYASAPLLRKAEQLGVPCLIQEQNGYAGLTNKMLAKRAQTICVAYDNMDKYFPKDKIVKTGNPVRTDIFTNDINSSDAKSKFNLIPDSLTVLVIGGSLGAKTINQSVASLLPDLKKKGIQLIWQTGKSYFCQAENEVKGFSNVFLGEFIYNMKEAYAAADVVISRAGALSISELCLVGKPVILIPSPNVTEDHQMKNAKALVSKKAVLLVRDDLASKSLGTCLFNLIDDEAHQKELSQNILKLGIADATDKIVNEVAKLIA